MKIVILQGDGMPDHPVPELGNKTPLEAANTPNMDDLAKRSIFGLVKTIPDELPPGSDVGNLSVLGYNPKLYYTGRSPLEAASIGVRVNESDVTFRCNLVTLKESNGKTIMEDYSAGHISTEEARGIILDIKDELEKEGEINFYPGVSYRHLLVWHGGVDRMKTTPPHDISGQEITAYLPNGEGADKLKKLIDKSKGLLKSHPINRKRIEQGKNPATSIWLWGQGRAPKMPRFKELYGIDGAVISAVDLVKGIGIYAGLRVIDVPGATGYLDTNYEGKVEYALRALKEVDLVMIHIESTDETGHEGKADLKIRAIEDFDHRVVGPVLQGMKRFDDYKVLVLSDHPTPIDLRTHVNEPVPFALFSSKDGGLKDSSRVYSEKSASQTGVFVDEGWKLVGMVLGKNQI
ncbi:MAG TPA: cofactor-independent phosphoglycerate mutase [Thermodesulfobacteriota bacterium]|nr:cofactor-independent phosphoglycerate mutase [Thermodesulfobacteriota bacterium]